MIPSVCPDGLQTDTHYILACDRRPTPCGDALRIHIERLDGAVMGFAEIQGVVQATWPGCCALMVFPPGSKLIDQANKYHLFLFPGIPAGMDLTDNKVRVGGGC
jgi:hypothetical protein